MSTTQFPKSTSSSFSDTPLFVVSDHRRRTIDDGGSSEYELEEIGVSRSVASRVFLQYVERRCRMAADERRVGVGTSSVTTHWDVMCLVTALLSAVCEWFLILLLFVHGLLSYFLREFANYCKLPTPCLLCSRFDHYFSNKVPESYHGMFCKNHGLEVFSHVACDDCLVSCVANENSVTEPHRLLRNKTSKTICQRNQGNNGCFEQSVFGSVGRRACSCCSKIWTSRQVQRGAIRHRSPVRELSKPNVPLPNVPSRKNLNHRDIMRRKREKSYGSLHSNNLWNDMMDTSANTGYRFVKVTSYSESEAPFSDSGAGKLMVMEAKIYREDNKLRNTSRNLADAQSNILAHLKSASKMCNTANLGADEGVAEIKMSDGVQNSSAPTLPELISLDDIPRVCNPLDDDLPCETTGRVSFETSPTLTNAPVIQQDNVSRADPCPSTKQIELSVKESSEKSRINEPDQEMVQHVVTLCATTTSVVEKFDDDGPSAADEHAPPYCSPSLSDSDTVLQTSAIVEKDETMKFHNGAEGQLSSTNEEYAHKTELQSNTRSSRSQGDNENSNLDNNRGSGECMTPREADSSERNESAFESTAGSVVSDREGESLVDRLKRQIEYDKERIASLYKELDEERSASAIAANQAMAMITRLQEEKAALNMETLHYSRGMEEQAEYDIEALEKANDLLSEKEKDIQDLEAELEHYRNKVSDGVVMEQKSEAAFSSNLGSHGEIRDENHPKHSNVPNFEEQKLYILKCLKGLEQKLLKLTGFEDAAFTFNVVNPGTMEDREPNGSQPGDHYEDNRFCNHEGLHMSNGNIKSEEVKKPKVLKSEASGKHDALEEMEASHDCCEPTLESHQMGHEEVLILEEIAHQLQELRKLVLKEHYVVP